MGYHKLKNAVTAGAVSLILGYGCGKSSPVQPANQINPYRSSQYETIDTRLNQAFPFAQLPQSQETFPVRGTPLTRNLAEIPIRSNVQNLHTAAKIASPLVTIIRAENLGYDLARYFVKITAPGYEIRETAITDDVKSPVLAVDEQLVPTDPFVQTLFKEAVQKSLRWKYPPKIIVSKDEEFMKYKDVHVTQRDIDLVMNALKQLPSQFGYYAEQAKVEFVDKSPWEPVNSNQTTRFPIKSPKGSILVQYNNTIPGIGAASLSDRDDDGYIDDAVVWLASNVYRNPPTILQEIGTVFLFKIHPNSLSPNQSVYVEGTSATGFTDIDTKAAHWGYKRPSFNEPTDKDNGWELRFVKNSKGIYMPAEEKLLLNGIVYRVVPMPGDFTEDNKIDFDDFFAFAEVFGTNNPEYDLSRNGPVDFDDFFIFAENFGRTRTIPGSPKPTIDVRVQEILQLPTSELKMNALTNRLEQEHVAKANFRRFLESRR